MLEITCREQISCHVNKVPDILLLYLHDFLNYPPIPFTFQYTNYEYGNFDDYTEGELTTDAPPIEQVKTEVTPLVHPNPPPFLLNLHAVRQFHLKKTFFTRLVISLMYSWCGQTMNK